MIGLYSKPSKGSSIPPEGILSEGGVVVSGRRDPQEAIMREVRGGIRRGELKPGMQLPIREDIIRKYDVSSVTVQRAFHRLTQDGFIVPRGRMGTFVAERPPNLFRVGVVYRNIKSVTLMNRHWLAFTAAMDEYGVQSEMTPVYYYGVGHDTDPGYRQSLFDDLRNERLAGLFWTWPEHLELPPTAMYRQCPVPVVHICRPAPGLNTVTMHGAVERSMAEMARLGARRVAVFMGLHEYAEIPVYQESARRHGLTLLRRWCFGMETTRPEWAGEFIDNLAAIPPDDGPDGLLVADDHFAEFVARALSEQGVAKRFKVVCHANFPALAALSMNAVRVGYDCRREVAEAFSLVGRLIERERAGLPNEKYAVVVPPCAEYELASPRDAGLPG